MDCKLLKYDWVTMRTGQDTELKAEKYGEETLWVQKIHQGKNYVSKYGTQRFGNTVKGDSSDICVFLHSIGQQR